MRGDAPAHRLQRLWAGGQYLFVAAVLTFLWRHVFFAGELIQSADLLSPLTMPALRQMFWPFWNEVLAFPNLETISRLAWMAPFLLLPSVLLAQKLMIAAAVLAAGMSMLFAAKRLGAPLVLALLAAVLFAYNPFVAVRLQHYFQLPGYAVLPATLALWLRPLDRRSALFSALLLTLGSSTPHYAVYLWSLGGLWLLFFFSSAALRRFATTFGLYFLFNFYWLVPSALFTRALALVPSEPTWELLELFSRNATRAAVARLQGYWWPLAEASLSPLVTLLGLGLVAAALISLTQPTRERLFLATGALVYGLIALGTHLPPLITFLSLEGPLAAPFGWLFRDPAKAVGPLAALLFLLAVQGARLRPRSNVVRVAVGASLLAAYGVFALATSGPYLRAAYESHTPPAAFAEANRWLAGRDGRVLWLPQYHGATTFWNGDNLTPEFPSYSSALPVLDPYAYNGRSVVSYLGLYFGVLLRNLDADLAKVLRAWGTRWLVHHRDLPPYRLQPPGTFNNQVELLQPSLESHKLERIRTFSPLTLYDAGAAPRAYLPGKVSVTDNPLAALVTLSNWSAYDPGHWSFVETPHAGVQDVALGPGGNARLVLAETNYSVDFARATVHYDPARYWSKLGETTLDWWSKALLAGLPADEGTTLLMTRAPGAQLTFRSDVPVGAYQVLLRVYRGPEAGAVKLELGEHSYTLDLFSPALETIWLDLGELSTEAALAVTLTNLDGFNVLAELRLVPLTVWTAAGAELAHLEQTWLWPSSTLCRELAASYATPFTVLEEEGNLPSVHTFGGAGAWRDYHWVSLDVYGDGKGTPLELWTNVEDNWLFLGGAHTWWRGWRTLHLSVKAEDFVFVSNAYDSPATNLKLITADGSGDAALRVRGVRLSASQRCTLQFTSSHETEASLSLSLKRPLSLSLNGRTLSLEDEAAQKVSLQTGTNTLALPLADVGAVRGIVVSTGPPSYGEPGVNLAETGAGTDLACAESWRLAVVSPFYLPGKVGLLAGTRLEATPVNYLRLGYWVPPELCGRLSVRITWVSLGWGSLLVSVFAFVTAVIWSFKPVHRVDDPASASHD